MHPDLIETLRLAQRLGFFGARAVEEAVSHAGAFVEALDGVCDDGRPASTGHSRRIVDLGSGGGLPGLVVADACRGSTVLLVDRREKRADFLRRAVRRLDFDHVTVRTGDVTDLVRDVESGEVLRFDAVTARGFGPPDVTLRLAAPLLAEGGRIVISEPPVGDRWDPALLAELGLTSSRRGAVRVFVSGR